ncbi:MAG: hypothetical protein AAFZ07_25585 [Actinomycetota bacterium]
MFDEPEGERWLVGRLGFGSDCLGDHPDDTPVPDRPQTRHVIAHRDTSRAVCDGCLAELEAEVTADV